jgi:biopolymer transport protein ExbB/TolQ
MLDVSQPASKPSISTIFAAIGWPLVFGGALSAIVFALIKSGPLNIPIVVRYCVGHPINMTETVMFCIGLVALVFKALDVLGQYGTLETVTLGARPSRKESAGDATRLLTLLGELPAVARNSYLGTRLKDALEAVRRQGSAEDLDDELKHLSDLDVGKQQDSYALVRIIVWAIPMLGFLGTVVGITEALGDLDPKQLSTSIETAVKGLTDGLYVAFDTTAIALIFAMILMFIQFFIDKVETQLLGAVDERVRDELTGRFELLGTSHDPHVASIERMSQAVLEATQTLVERQAEIWQATISSAHAHWERLAAVSGDQLQAALRGAIDDAVEGSARQLDRRWEQWQLALSENAQLLQNQQREMVRQGELMTEAIRVTGEVVTLEHALHENLTALAGAKHFEDTLSSLAAAIHLLSAKLGRGEGPLVDLKPPKGRAA